MNVTTAGKAFDFENLDKEIKRTMRRSASDVVQLGFMLRRMMEERLWASRYDCFDDYLDTELHMEYSVANRFININKKYSLFGASAEIAEEYKGYSQGLLVEMLSMPPELEEKVTPDMTVKQVREIKKRARKEQEPKAESVKKKTFIDGEYREIKEPEKVATSQGIDKKLVENCAAYKAHGTCDGCYYDSNIGCPYDRNCIEKQSPYGLTKSVYPEESLIATHGCGNRHDCFSCAKDCNIRQDNRYCVEAPLGNPFACTVMNDISSIEQELPELCQFVNEELAFHRMGDNQPVPCCKRCKVTECRYRCARSDQQPQEDSSGQFETDELSRIKRLLNEKKYDLEEWTKVAKVREVPESVIFEKKTVVGALAAMVCELENVWEEINPAQQPNLPVLKNDEQRKSWLQGYKDWGLWYRDENIDVNYYKFDFEDGSRLVVSEYPQRHEYWSDRLKDEAYYHLLEKNRKSYQKSYDEIYRHREDSETYLVEFLKNLQKKMKG